MPWLPGRPVTLMHFGHVYSVRPSNGPLGTATCPGTSWYRRVSLIPLRVLGGIGASACSLWPLWAPHVPTIPCGALAPSL